MALDLPALRTVDIDGPLVYREWEGPPETTFVLVHGLGGSHANWVLVSRGLSGLGRTLAVDLPGFGWTPRAGRPTGLMDLRRVLAGFLDQRSTGRIVVAGNSMGGAIAMLEAAVEPDRLAGLVLTSSVFPWARGAIPHPAVVGGFALYDMAGIGERFVRTRMQRMPADRAVRLGFRMIVADPPSIPDDVVQLHVEGVLERARDPEAPAAFLDTARSLLRLGRRPRIAARAMDAIRCPVLVIHGRRDRFVPARFAEATLVRYPTWRGRILPDVGHAPQLETPGRWLAEVADWYAERVDRP